MNRLLRVAFSLFLLLLSLSAFAQSIPTATITGKVTSDGAELPGVLVSVTSPNLQGTRTPCLEIMKRDAGVQEAIQSNNLHLLTGIIEVSLNQGMHSFDQYLLELLAAGIIERAAAHHYAVNKHKLEMALRGIQTLTPILRPDKDRSI